jgi:hypothetical protein
MIKIRLRVTLHACFDCVSYIFVHRGLPKYPIPKVSLRDTIGFSKGFSMGDEKLPREDALQNLRRDICRCGLKHIAMVGAR